MRTHIMNKTQNQNQNPPWEDLNPFILSKIFSCLSLQDQLFGPPYVCRPWLSTTLDTLFHNSVLDLRLIDELEHEDHRLRFTHLLKRALYSHQSNWVSIYLPSKYCFGYFATVYIAERSRNVSSVILPSNRSLKAFPIYISLFYWEKVRVFHTRLNPNDGFCVIPQLVDCCKNLVELGLHGKLTENEVLCIMEGFPRLKVLDISESSLSMKALGILLNGRLKYLKELNMLHCLILDEEGKNIRNRDYYFLKDWRREMLGKVKQVKVLKNLHCLEQCCQQCKDVSLKYDKNLWL